MKKITILILMVLLMQNFAYSVPTQSTNEFPLMIEEAAIPPGGEDSSGGGGLSGGAVTAITLGSIGGAALLGGLAWYLKPYWSKGLASGCAAGLDAPIVPLCLDCDKVNEMLCKYQNYPLLKAALQMNEIHECPCSKYVLIPDTQVQQNKFNMTVFSIPTELKNQQGLVNVIITQVSTPFSGNEVESKMYLKSAQVSNKNDVNSNFKIVSSSPENGVVVRSGQIDTSSFNNPEGVLITSYTPTDTSKSSYKNYAYLIEFIK